MKALTIKQPWATFILGEPMLVLGDLPIKPVENRTWRSDYRGNLLIHASKSVDQTAFNWVEKRFGRRPWEITWRLGGIVGMVRMVDCVTQHPSRWFDGPFGFVFTDPYELKFEPCQGKLGLWDYNLQLT